MGATNHHKANNNYPSKQTKHDREANKHSRQVEPLSCTNVGDARIGVGTFGKAKVSGSLEVFGKLQVSG